MKKIHDEFLGPVREQLLSRDALRRARKMIPKLLAERRRAPDQNKIEARLAEIDEQLGNLVEYVKRGESETIRSEITRLEHERSDLQTQLTYNDDHDKVIKMVPKIIDRYTKLVDDFDSKLTQPHVHRARNALRKLGLTDIVLTDKGDKLVARGGIDYGVAFGLRGKEIKCPDQDSNLGPTV